MIMAGDAEIRVLTLPEVEDLIGWAALEGWKPGAWRCLSLSRGRP